MGRAAYSTRVTMPYEIEHALPDPLPADPMPLFHAWLDEAFAQRIQPNPNAMTLATVDADGQPSARTVLCKGIDESLGRVTFYTNRQSRKGMALKHEPRVALLFHWDAFDRQVRIEGRVTQTTDQESDAYFQSRRIESRLGAWASDQSKPIASRDELLSKVVDAMARFKVSLDDMEAEEIPRPPHWGGYHVWANRVELWVGGPGRVHDRARWERTLNTSGDGFSGGPWSVTRLQP